MRATCLDNFILLDLIILTIYGLYSGIKIFSKRLILLKQETQKLA
jgi:hypothetical protein